MYTYTQTLVENQPALDTSTWTDPRQMWTMQCQSSSSHRLVIAHYTQCAKKKNICTGSQYKNQYQTTASKKGQCNLCGITSCINPQHRNQHGTISRDKTVVRLVQRWTGAICTCHWLPLYSSDKCYICNKPWNIGKQIKSTDCQLDLFIMPTL